MKKNLVLLVLFPISLLLIGQKYQPFPTNNVVCSGEAMSLKSWYSQYKWFGDTIINGEKYSKVYNGDMNYNFVYKAAVRQDSSLKKMYVLLKNSQTEKEIPVNAELSIGDTVKITELYAEVLFGEPMAFIVDSIDSVQIGSKWHKRYLKRNGKFDDFDEDDEWYPNPSSASYIEGVGLESYIGFEWGGRLICFSHNNIEMFEPESLAPYCNLYTGIEELGNYSWTIYPNPSSDIIKLDFNEDYRDKTIIVTNTLGELIFRSTTGDNFLTLNISDFPDAVHFVAVNIDNKLVAVKKFLKK